MKREKEIKFLELVRVLNRHKIRYLVIGRRAVILYGGPVLTADNDIWLHPKDKKNFYSFFQKTSTLNFPILLRQKNLSSQDSPGPRSRI